MSKQKRKNVNWSEGIGNKVLQKSCDLIRKAKAEAEAEAIRILGCTKDAIHIRMRRELGENPDSDQFKKVCKNAGWQQRLKRG